MLLEGSVLVAAWAVGQAAGLVCQFFDCSITAFGAPLEDICRVQQTNGGLVIGDDDRADAVITVVLHTGFWGVFRAQQRWHRRHQLCATPSEPFSWVEFLEGGDVFMGDNPGGAVVEVPDDEVFTLRPIKCLTRRLKRLGLTHRGFQGA